MTRGAQPRRRGSPGFAGVCCAVALTACTPTRTRIPPQVLPPTDVSDASVPPEADDDDVGAPRVSPEDALASADSGAPPADPAVLCADGPRNGPARWWDDAVVYEVFVRSFQDSDGDGVGDLRGLIQRLDYLNDGDPSTSSDLGVTALWLMPINPSPSTHGYDVTDYRSVNPEYGSMADLDALVAEASARGMHVVMDLVLNHTSDKHPWFVKGKRGAPEPTADWYLFRPDRPEGWGQPWSPGTNVWHALGDQYYYGLFWSGMPDLNVANPAVSSELRDIAQFWSKRGIAGFRLDAARYLVENGPGDGQADQPETHAFWRDLRAQLGADTLLLGEVWTALPTAVSYLGAGDELQLVFDFDREDALRQSLRLGTAAPLGGATCKALGAVAGSGLATFLGNHDLDRLGSDVRDPAARRLAHQLLLTLPGTPVLYYGDELGLDNGAGGGDEAKRLPMRWDGTAHAGFTTGDTPWAKDSMDAVVPPVSAQLADPGSLLSAVRAAVALRQSSAALRVGQTVRLAVADAPAVLAFVREVANESVLVVANLSGAEVPGLTVETAGHTQGVATVALGEAPLEVMGSGVRLGPIAPYDLRVLRFLR